MTSEWVRDFWAVIAALVGFVVWLVRLEGHSKQNAAAIEAIREQRKEDLRSHQTARDATNRLLDEIRADIKQLLSKGR